MEVLNKNSVDVQSLVSILLSTLDESVFFVELMKQLSNEVKADKALVYVAHEDATLKLLVENSVATSNKNYEKNEGLAAYVLRTKKPYFSNNVSRDPIFAKESNKALKAELAIPVSVDGVVLATIHFQSESEKEFSVNDMTKVIATLAEIKKPLANMKMFLAAKQLNEVLLRKIENKANEVSHSKQDISLIESYRISDVDLVGKSEAMKSLISIASKLAQSEANYLIVGEAGTGKEVFARKIHTKSSRKEKAFVAVDCSSLDEAALEIEIFGLENGKIGLLEIANGGTILLKKISSLSSNLQSKLASFIKDGRAFRAQGQVPYKSQARVVASESKNLREEVEAGSFRSDLYYALNAMTLEVLALRDHKDDVEALTAHFMNGRQKALSPSALKVLKEHDWKGNIRELKSVVERACILADGMVIEVEHLSDSVMSKSDKAPEAAPQEEVQQFVQMTLDELEKRHICQTLEFLGGNKTRAAKTLGITVKTLYNKLHNYGLIDERDAQ